jgi:hypothetical protein
MSIQKIALISNHAVAHTTAHYFAEVFEEKGISFDRFFPEQQREIGKEYSVRFYVDAGDHYLIEPQSHTLKAIYIIDTHMGLHDDLYLIKFADVVFCAQYEAVEILSRIRKNVFWLPLGCSEKYHFLGNAEKKFDIAYIGGTDPESSRDNGNPLLRRRIEMLRLLKNRYPNNFIGPAPRERIGEIYSKSKIVVNISVNNDLNMRFFEGICSGSLVVTEKLKDNGFEMLVDNTNSPVCVEYDGMDDLVKKIDYYLNNELERTRIARNGKLFSNSQTYVSRWTQIEGTISTIKPRGASVMEYRFTELKLELDRLGRKVRRKIKTFISR